ncbi:hypothetical protein BKA65DRAFT_554204 [Rhexocercosporidium sp. MPI-PUGE-AT-0058]|nr:hypothetical protein BKA65DRAFT_554204 [Rhexocercosporidium sp. MPI-PUGE-AT-0058]
MLPTSLLALTASFIAPILAAPSCTPSSNGYAAQKMIYLFNDFCEGLTESNFATKQKYYDMPVVALSFTPAAVGDCSLKECLTSFGSLVDACDKDDKSIWGTGNVASSCGTYSFEIKDISVTKSLGAPDATITAATIKTYDVATLTSSSSSTSTSSSSPSSYKASTTSEAQLESTYAPSTQMYLNATTSTASSNSSTAYQSATLTVSPSSSLVAASTTATKPEVGTATLGTSGASVLRVSGLSLVLVAGVFGVFL